MADPAPLETLNRALDDMQAKAKELADSLQRVSSQGMAPVSAGIAQAPRQPAGSIAADALSRTLRQELAAGMESLFAGRGNMNGANAGMNITIQNNSSAAVSARETDTGFDQKSLEITIDQMVANSLLRGRETTGVLRSLFNLVPVLMGR